MSAFSEYAVTRTEPFWETSKAGAGARPLSESWFHGPNLAGTGAAAYRGAHKVAAPHASLKAGERVSG